MYVCHVHACGKYLLVVQLVGLPSAHTFQIYVNGHGLNNSIFFIVYTNLLIWTIGAARSVLFLCTHDQHFRFQWACHPNLATAEECRHTRKHADQLKMIQNLAKKELESYRFMLPKNRAFNCGNDTKQIVFCVLDTSTVGVSAPSWCRIELPTWYMTVHVLVSAHQRRKEYIHVHVL